MTGWRADDLHQHQIRFGTDQFLDAFRIIDARHLQKDLAGSFRALPLQRRLFHTKSVDAAFDDLQRLFDRLILRDVLSLRAASSTRSYCRWWIGSSCKVDFFFNRVDDRLLPGSDRWSRD